LLDEEDSTAAGSEKKENTKAKQHVGMCSKKHCDPQ
jgi:hypothetical protein